MPVRTTPRTPVRRLPSGSGVLAAFLLATAPADGQRAPRELTPAEQARHVLDRLAFGARPGEAARVEAMGVDRWIDRQLSPSRIDDGGLDAAIAQAFPASTRDATALLRQYPPPALKLIKRRLKGDSTVTRDDSLELRRAVMENRAFVGDLLGARVARAVASERQLQEVMTDFWLNHFSVFVGKGQLRYFLADYEREAIRPHALGHFRELLGAVAHSPAMLLYLDNAQSVADSTRPTLVSRRRAGPGVPFALDRLSPRARARLEARMRQDGRRIEEARVSPDMLRQLQARRPRGINENYARELLELHTLGVDGGYTQRDIIEVARALTGWGVLPLQRGDGGFRFNAAAHDAGEKVVLGHRLPAGRGEADGEAVLDIVARHPSTARFIARKLAVRLVSDSPPGALVERAATTFTRTDGDLREVVRTIVTSPEFFSRAAYRAKVKSPFEVVVSTARALGADFDPSPATARAIGRLGQPVYGRQTPDGWPETGDEWMNTGAILARINFGLAVAGGRLPGATPKGWSEYSRLADAPRATQVDGIVDALLGGNASDETRDILRRGENPMLTATGADSGDADRRGGRMRALAGLDQLIGLALGSPEFQRR